MYLLEQITGINAASRVNEAINAKGQASKLYADTSIELKHSGVAKSRQYRILAPLNVATRLEILEGGYVRDNSGVNPAFLDEYMQTDLQAWALEAKRSGLVAPKDIPQFADAYHDRVNSEVGLLYNLIRQYMCLSLPKGGYGANSDYYNDGHVAATYADVFGMTPLDEIELIVNKHSIMSRTGGTLPYLYWRGMTRDNADILFCGLCELVGNGAYAIAASSPALLEEVNFYPVTIHDDPTVAWKNRRLVASTLCAVVEAGHLYNQFDIALHMVAQTACHIKAPVAEAVNLCASEHSIELPMFDSFRFKLHGMVTGDMGGVRPSAQACYKAWKASPSAMWMYSAILRSAAEFRGSITFGTDFDANDEVYRQARNFGVTGLVGTWMALAASALGKTLYTQPGVALGATLANYEQRIPMRVVGPLDARYRVLTRQGEGESLKVTLGMWGDDRRVPLHSKFLFATGLLPSSKVGRIVMKAELKVEMSDRRSRRAIIRGEHVDAYMTMCRAFGWDVTLETGPGLRTTSWADNYSRLAWGANNFQEYPHATVYVLDSKPRNDPKIPIWFAPHIPGVYSYEARIIEVGTLYDYSNPDATGGHIPKVCIIPKGKGQMAVTRANIVMDLALKDFTITASRADFQMVEEPGALPPPVAVPPEAHDDVAPPGNDEEWVDDDLQAGDLPDI